MLDKLDLNTKAQELREMLGEDANSPIDIVALASQIDQLTLVYYPLGENISGMCVTNNDVKLIAINSTMSYGRQRFSLAHEFYHLYFDKASGFNVCSKKFDTSNEIEQKADQFASYFLAPYKSLKSMVKKKCKTSVPKLEEIIALEQYFGMSHKAMLWRLISENYLNKTYWKQYKAGVISEANKLGYDDKLYKPLPQKLQKKTYGYYLKQVGRLQKEDLVSPGKIDELLLDAYRDDIAFGDDEEEKGREIVD